MSVSGGFEFVQLVQQYPCLYNSDLPDYGRKDPSERAWQEIADEMEWSIPECKDKWKNIRNGYVRSLKPGTKNKAKKPYYLCDTLQFLLPFINPATNIQIDPRRSVIPKVENEQTDDNEEQETDDNEVEVSPKAVLPRPRKIKSKMVKKSSDVDKALVSWLHNKRPKADDPRKMFLQSLLPDVRSLTDEQLAVFRIKVLLLLEEVKSQTSSLKELLDQLK